MSPRNREIWVEARDTDAERTRALAAWNWYRRHITAGTGRVCELMRDLREDAHGETRRES